MNFRKPPVVEVWISVEFESNPNKHQWELDLVKEYVRQYESELPTLEAVHSKKIQVQETSTTDLPKVISQEVRLDAVRLWNKPRSHHLQVGKDNLSYHILKSTDDTPGYRKVRIAAQPKLEDFVSIFQPKEIRHATLHYLDIVDIPCPETGKIELGDYFATSADLPEDPFGPITGLTYQFQLACPDDVGPLFLQLQTMPSPPEDEVIRFRMEWHKQSSDVGALDLSQVWERMDVAHAYMRKCFLAAFTQRTLELFELIDEN